MTPDEVPVALAVRSAAGALPAPPPEAGRVVLQLEFFKTVSHLLARADQQILEGHQVDLDALGQLLSMHLRYNLAIVHGGPLFSDREVTAARDAFIATLEAARRGDPDASANLPHAQQRFLEARRAAERQG